MEPTSVTNEELKKLLEDVLDATEENTKLIKAMRRDALIGGIVKFIFWILLILLSFYISLKFIEPYLGMLQGGESSNEDYGALIEQYKSLLGQ